MKPSPGWWALGVLAGLAAPAAGLWFVAHGWGPCGRGDPAAQHAAYALIFPALPFYPLIGEAALLAVPFFWFAVPLLIGRVVEARQG